MICPINEYIIVINVYNLMTLGAILVLASLAKTLRYSLGKPTWFFMGVGTPQMVVNKSLAKRFTRGFS